MPELLDNYEENLAEVFEFLKGLKDTTFKDYSCSICGRSLDVYWGNSDVSIQANFDRKGDQVTDSLGQVFQEMILTIEVWGQRWAAKTSEQVEEVIRLNNLVLSATRDIEKKFGSSKVYFLLRSVKQRDEDFKKYCFLELQNQTQKNSKGLRVGKSSTVIHQVIDLDSKKLLITGEHLVSLDGKDYRVTVSPQKDLIITRLA